MSNLSEDIEKLLHLDHFLRLGLHMEAERERYIKDLRGAEDGKIREVSGKIQVCDDFLDLIQWNSVRSRAHNLKK